MKITSQYRISNIDLELQNIFGEEEFPIALEVIPHPFFLPRSKDCSFTVACLCSLI